MPTPAGLLTVIKLALTTVKFVARVVPKVTVVAPVKPFPMIDTIVPPNCEPIVGVRAATVGTAA